MVSGWRIFPGNTPLFKLKLCFFPYLCHYVIDVDSLAAVYDAGCISYWRIARRL